jgi:hypothetical protein
MQFTRISQITNNIGVTLCRKTLGKIRCFAMWPLGAAGRRGLLDSGELAAEIGRGRARG